MVRTFEKAQKEESTDGKNTLGLDRSGGFTPREFTRDLEEVLFPTPDGLVGTAVETRQQDRERRREEMEVSLDASLLDQFGVGLEEIDASINSLHDQEIDQLGELQALRFIAEAIRTLVIQNKIMLDQDSAKSIFLNDIATAVEPATDVVVSGTEVIEDPEVPQEILPEDVRVRTRSIMVRADQDNEVPIYFGDDNVEPRNGFVLVPGEWINFEVSHRDAQIHMAAEKKGERVQLLGVI